MQRREPDPASTQRNNFYVEVWRHTVFIQKQTERYIADTPDAGHSQDFSFKILCSANFRTNDKNLIGRRTAYHDVPDRHAAQSGNRRNVSGGREIKIAGDHRLNRRNAGRDHNQFEIEALLLVEPLAQRYHLRKRAHAPSRYADPKLLRFLRLVPPSRNDKKYPSR